MINCITIDKETICPLDLGKLNVLEVNDVGTHLNNLASFDNTLSYITKSKVGKFEFSHLVIVRSGINITLYCKMEGKYYFKTYSYPPDGNIELKLGKIKEDFTCLILQLIDSHESIVKVL